MIEQRTQVTIVTIQQVTSFRSPYTTTGSATAAGWHCGGGGRESRDRVFCPQEVPNSKFQQVSLVRFVKQTVLENIKFQLC